MARASTYTLLSLDRFARIMGINPCHFNGGKQVNLDNGRILYPLDNAMNNIWPQYDYQDADKVSREQMAELIREAELDISAMLGFFPAPDWVVEEQHEFSMNYRPEIAGVQLNVRSGNMEIPLRLGEFISGGVRAVEKLADVDIVYTDTDLDGWEEHGIISLDIGASDALTENIKFYFSGKSGAREWEIRPPISLSKTGTTINATFNTYQLIDQDIIELPASGDDTYEVDISDPPENLVAAIEVWHEYNDSEVNSAEFFRTLVATPESLGGGFVRRGGIRTNIGTVIPAQFTDGTWSTTSLAHIPNFVKLWYYSGKIEQNYRAITNDKLWDRVAKAIAYLAVARLERIYYTNSNATTLAENLRVDNALITDDSRRIVPFEELKNPFGTKEGEMAAWRIVRKILVRSNMKGAVI